MRRIKLGKNATKHIGHYALVDDEDYEELNKYNWCARYEKDTDSFYVVRTIPRGTLGSGKTMYMHRQIMQTPKGIYTDHRNHNTLDNRRKNLRVVTPIQNNQNRYSDKKSSSKFKGVSWHSTREKWRAQIQVDKKSRYLGLFVCEEQAAKAYDEICIKYHGEFARPNLTEKQRAELPSTHVICDFTSEYRGVSRHKLDKKWRAVIAHRGKQKFLGNFIDKKEAALAYDEAARKYHGKKARLNFPEEK